MTILGCMWVRQVRWVTFHSGYDFGYLLKVVTCSPLPATETEFFELLKVSPGLVCAHLAVLTCLQDLTCGGAPFPQIYFPVVFDIKYLMKFCNNLHGGLSKLAELLDVERIGPQHQAGSDSLLTSSTFLKLADKFFSVSQHNMSAY